MIEGHFHTMNYKHYPEWFPNKPLGLMNKNVISREMLNGFLHCAIPFSDNDVLDKMRNMINAGRKDQESIFLDGLKLWGKDAKIVILTVDMNHMGCGRTKEPFAKQVYDVDILYRKYPNNVLPFLHLDCRNELMYELFDEYILNRNWTGVKLYLPMGCFPTDTRYKRMWEALNDLRKPVITHCTYGNPVHWRGSRRELKKLLGDRYDPKLSIADNCDKFTDPYNFIPILEKYKNVPIVFAHGGGSDYWIKYLKGDRSPDNPFTKCLRLIEYYLMAHIDCAYTGANKQCAGLLKMMLNDIRYDDKICFGSDITMSLNKQNAEYWVNEFVDLVGIKEFEKMQKTNKRIFL